MHSEFAELRPENLQQHKKAQRRKASECTIPKFSVGNKVVHVKSGGVYLIRELPTRVRLELADTPAYMYEEYPATEDSKLWVRSQKLMEDGRFVKLED